MSRGLLLRRISVAVAHMLAALFSPASAHLLQRPAECRVVSPFCFVCVKGWRVKLQVLRATRFIPEEAGHSLEKRDKSLPSPQLGCFCIIGTATCSKKYGEPTETKSFGVFIGLED